MGSVLFHNSSKKKKKKMRRKRASKIFKALLLTLHISCSVQDIALFGNVFLYIFCLKNVLMGRKGESYFCVFKSVLCLSYLLIFLF
jgi:hypothetical protein